MGFYYNHTILLSNAKIAQSKHKSRFRKNRYLAKEVDNHRIGYCLTHGYCLVTKVPARFSMRFVCLDCFNSGVKFDEV